jgi:hypothetical protein
MNWKKMWWIIPVAPVALAGFIALGGWAVMSLWNWLAPALFGWKVIGFWQALGLLALCRILFGGLGHHGGPGGPGRGDRKKWGRCSPEEREKFREQMHARWHGEGVPAAEQNPSA